MTLETCSIGLLVNRSTFVEFIFYALLMSLQIASSNYIWGSYKAFFERNIFFRDVWLLSEIFVFMFVAC